MVTVPLPLISSATLAHTNIHRMRCYEYNMCTPTAWRLRRKKHIYGTYSIKSNIFPLSYTSRAYSARIHKSKIDEVASALGVICGWNAYIRICITYFMCEKFDDLVCDVDDFESCHFITKISILSASQQLWLESQYFVMCVLLKVLTHFTPHSAAQCFSRYECWLLYVSCARSRVRPLAQNIICDFRARRSLNNSGQC